MRLTDSPEFERVYRQGTAFRGRLFSLHAFPNEIGFPRLGLSVAKKVGNAVTRNAVRRRLKGVFQGVGQNKRLREASEGVREASGGVEESEHRVDPGLPRVRLPHAADVLQVYPELLSVRPPGHREIRRTAGHTHGHPQDTSLPPVRQGRIRPGKMKTA